MLEGGRAHLVPVLELRQERDVYSIMPNQPMKLRRSGMFERSRLILPTGKCNADRTEHGGTAEIRGILLETTFVDDASLGCECSSSREPDVNEKRKTRHNLPATKTCTGSISVGVVARSCFEVADQI